MKFHELNAHKLEKNSAYTFHFVWAGSNISKSKKFCKGYGIGGIRNGSYRV